MLTDTIKELLLRTLCNVHYIFFRETPQGSLFLCINTHMDDKKAAKLIIRRRKKNPFLYTKEEVKYAKLIKRNIKDQENSSK